MKDSRDIIKKDHQNILKTIEKSSCKKIITLTVPIQCLTQVDF